MTRTKAKSVNVYEIRMWSLKHYGGKATKDKNMYNGCITEKKSGHSVWFRSPAKLLQAIEDLYQEAEARTIVAYPRVPTGIWKGSTNKTRRKR